MSCNCITKINELLKKQFNDSAEMDAGIMAPTGTARVRIQGLYHKVKKDGSYAQKWDTINVIAEYCPLCGKKYDEGK